MREGHEEVLHIPSGVYAPEGCRDAPSQTPVPEPQCRALPGSVPPLLEGILSGGDKWPEADLRPFCSS